MKLMQSELFKKRILPLIILLMGSFYIFVISPDPSVVTMLFKIIPMLLIIAYAYFHFPTERVKTHWILLFGLVFSMLGDALLVWWFVPGLTAFLTGHLFYLTGFLGQWRYSLLRFASIIPIGIYAFFMGNELVTALQQSGQSALIIPVVAYIIVIALMMWSSIMSGNPWAIAGSLLFGISDSILSWDMFVNTISYSHVLIMTTYYGAQFLIARSIAGFPSRSGLRFTSGRALR